MKSDSLFNVETPINFSVHTTKNYWDSIIAIKHPIMNGRENDVIQTLINPDEIRQSKKDRHVYLFYHNLGKSRWICVVTKKLNGEGFIITAYVTDSIKEGKQIWSK